VSPLEFKRLFTRAEAERALPLVRQIVPSILADIESGPDRARANRVLEAVLKMKKLNIKDIEKAARG